MSTIDVKRELLLNYLRGLQSCAVAFSAGVDSTVVAKAAQLALGERAVAITGTSASMAQGEVEDAVRLAAIIGIRHEIIPTEEFSQPSYLQNSPDRCYHCKTELYTQLERLIPHLDVAVVVNGANVDDLSDYRPGMRAATEHAVHSPLAACGITKDDVRLLARDWNLPIWDKPATPCLASRVAYGEEVTPERLAMIDAAERFLRSHNLRTVRVRYHKGNLARLEIPLDALPTLIDSTFRTEVVKRFHEIGFTFVALDLEGFRSGSMNQLVQLNV